MNCDHKRTIKDAVDASEWCLDCKRCLDIDRRMLEAWECMQSVRKHVAAREFTSEDRSWALHYVLEAIGNIELGLRFDESERTPGSQNVT